jgi:hypothetical protein
MGTVQIEDVVAPIRAEEGAMRVEKAVIGRFGIRMSENVEEFGKKIDEHATR